MQNVKDVFLLIQLKFVFKEVKRIYFNFNKMQMYFVFEQDFDSLN